MIIPCMNSISAWEGWGKVGLADAGSVLLGIPGAPGCTTTEVDCANPCCAGAGVGNKPATAHAAMRTLTRGATPVGDSSTDVRRKERLLSLGVPANISSVLT